jgi:hypothetical protein
MDYHRSAATWSSRPLDGPLGADISRSMHDLTGR